MKSSIIIGVVALATVSIIVLGNENPGAETLVLGESVCSTTVGNYAELDAKDRVIRIIVADECFIQSGAVGDPATWVYTDYSMPEKAAAIGGKYDSTAKKFITKDDVRKYGDTVKVKDIIVVPLEQFIATST